VNNNAGNIKAAIMLISLKYTQNSLKYTTTDGHLYSTAHSNICTWLFCRKMLEYWYPSRLTKTICKWDIHVLLVTKGLNAVESILVLKL